MDLFTICSECQVMFKVQDGFFYGDFTDGETPIYKAPEKITVFCQSCVLERRYTVLKITVSRKNPA